MNTCPHCGTFAELILCDIAGEFICRECFDENRAQLEWDEHTEEKSLYESEELD